MLPEKSYTRYARLVKLFFFQRRTTRECPNLFRARLLFCRTAGHPQADRRGHDQASTSCSSSGWTGRWVAGEQGKP